MNRFEGNSDASATSRSLSGGMGGALASTGAPAGSVGPPGKWMARAYRRCRGVSFALCLTATGRIHTVLIGSRWAKRPTDTGTLLLHDLSKSAEAVVSSTSLAAPKDAKKSLDKAREEISKRDFTDAEADLKKAVQTYPKYAGSLAGNGRSSWSTGASAPMRKLRFNKPSQRTRSSPSRT